MIRDLRRLLRAAFAPQVPPRCEPCASPAPRDAHGRPLVSVVTIVLNRRGTLPRTIESVRAQTYPHLEYIVLDGGSTDGTIEVIEANLDRIDRWRSARDGGLYEALNEGVRQARGEFIQFVHSDDWLEPRQIEHAVETATVAQADYVHGDLMLHLETGESVRVPGAQDWASLRPREFPAIRHPTVLARRSLYERVGLFRTDTRIASDFDWLWRTARAGAVGAYDPRVMSHMAEGGVSTRRQKLCLSEYVVLTATLPAIPRGICRGYLYLLATNGMPFALLRKPWHLARGAARRCRSGTRATLAVPYRLFRRTLSLAKRAGRGIIVGTQLERPARAAWRWWR
ncbi:MAG: glycosyltransferase family 2 protein, partial [Planctomycetota bacterium]